MTDPLHAATAPGHPALSDPHGRAALLLVESLLHGLVARSVISVAEAVAIVVTAVDVEADLADEAALVGVPETSAAAMLERIVKSLSIDLPATHAAGPDAAA